MLLKDLGGSYVNLITVFHIINSKRNTHIQNFEASQTLKILGVGREEQMQANPRKIKVMPGFIKYKRKLNSFLNTDFLNF